jgi:hypothetical protein
MSPSDEATTPMTVEEARQVLWITERRRTLGEMWDEGLLTEQRLTWAVENAYNPRLRQAAAVLLEEMRQRRAEEPAKPLSFGITRQEALMTPWPFRPYRGRPIGELLSRHQLSLKDLAYAVDKAWSERVRRAAALLLVEGLGHRVEEPSEHGVLRVVVAGPSYAERAMMRLSSIGGLVMGLLMGFFLMLAFWSWKQHLGHTPAREYTPEVKFLLTLLALSIGGLLGLLPNILVERLILRRIEEAIKRHRRGKEGEERVVELLRQVLDDRWTLYRNLKVPGMGRGDLDGVLVGPTGVWLLEIKNFSGRYRNRGEQWFYWKHNGWRRMKDNPSRQARRNAGRLAAFLKERGVRLWVYPVIVWANPEKPPVLESPAVPVWTMDRLAEEVMALKQQREVDEESLRRVEAYLSEVVALQREEEEEA